MDNTRIIWTAIIGGILIIGFMAVFVDIILFSRKQRKATDTRSDQKADTVEKEAFVRIKLLKEISLLLEQKKASKA
jgi:hypothetical protein